MPVRYDPFDAGLAYAFVKGRWVRALSEHHATFAGRSEREILLASAELRRQQQQHGQHLVLTARKLADFLASVEAEEVLLAQRLRDAAAKDLGRVPTGSLGGKPIPKEETDGAFISKPTRPKEPLSGEDALVVYEDY